MSNNIQLWKLLIGFTIFIIGLALFINDTSMQLAIFVIAYLIIGGDILLNAARNIIYGQVFDENFLMSIATIGAFAIGEYHEAIGVMLFFQVGEYFQEYAVNKSRKSIAGLMSIRPDYANLMRGDDMVIVDPEEVAIDDIIVIKPGERIPLDGVIVEGKSSIDASALTGESIPNEAFVGSQILSGCVNINGLIKVKVSKVYEESTVAKILDLVENASDKKSQSENFITKFARYYTPSVVMVAILLAVIPPLFTDALFSDWLYRALIFLVISCPCALVISIPLSFFGGIGACSSHGILVKGSNYLEALSYTDTVVFDKTGTLTKGVFNVVEVVNNDISKDDLLRYAAYAEKYSSHPIGLSIINAYDGNIDDSIIRDVAEDVGYGVKAIVDGKLVIVGNYKLMLKENIVCDGIDTIGAVVHIAIDGSYKGYLVIQDELKDDSLRVISDLKAIGVNNTVLLTGDNELVAENVANKLGLDRYYSQLLPADKVDKVEELLRETHKNGNLVFVGDGINDAPVLARADIGVAMGGLGSDAAIEAADVVIMTDEPSKLVDAIKISKKTRKIVKQNIVFALGVKFAVLILGAVGVATMWEAVFADVGVAMIAIINSMRALKYN